MLVRTSKDKDHPYVIINKSFLEDSNISLKAKGLLAYCMAKPDGWKFHISQMANVLKEGRDSIYSAFKELIKFGYCVHLQGKNENGRFSSGEYILYEIPIKKEENLTEKPYTENPDAVNADPEKPALVNNDNSNKDKNNNLYIAFGKFVKFTEKQYDSLCKEHDKEKVDEIIQAINDYCVNSRPKGYKDYTAAFRTFLKNYKASSKATTSKTNHPVEANKKFAQEIERCYKSKTHRIDLLSKSMEFTPLSGQMLPDEISYASSEAAFKEQVKNILIKRNFVEIKKC